MGKGGLFLLCQVMQRSDAPDFFHQDDLVPGRRVDFTGNDMNGTELRQTRPLSFPGAVVLMVVATAL